MFIFGSVFIKKITKTIFFKKTEIETGLNRLNSVILEQKPVWLDFFGLDRFFSSLARFFFVWVQFGSVFSVSCL